MPFFSARKAYKCIAQRTLQFSCLHIWCIHFPLTFWFCTIPKKKIILLIFGRFELLYSVKHLFILGEQLLNLRISSRSRTILLQTFQLVNITAFNLKLELLADTISAKSMIANERKSICICFLSANFVFIANRTRFRSLILINKLSFFF